MKYLKTSNNLFGLNSGFVVWVSAIAPSNDTESKSQTLVFPNPTSPSIPPTIPPTPLSKGGEGGIGG